MQWRLSIHSASAVNNLDDETSLVYYNYRYYSPELGRWLSRDPIEEEGGWNLYAMEMNLINNSYDILGLSRVSRFLGKCLDLSINSMVWLKNQSITGTKWTADKIKQGYNGIDAFAKKVWKPIARIRKRIYVNMIACIDNLHVKNIPYLGWYLETLKPFARASVAAIMLDVPGATSSTLGAGINAMNRVTDDF